MEYLKEKAEGYVAQWLMKDPDAINQVDPWWFHSIVGKAIVWSAIKARRAGKIDLQGCKDQCDWSRTRAKPEHFDLVYNQQAISNEALEWCVNWFKLIGMITQLKESEIDGKIKFTSAQREAIAKVIVHIKEGTDTSRMREVIYNFWLVKLNRQPLMSQKAKLELIETKRQQIINQFN